MLKDYRRDLASDLLSLRKALSDALDDPSRSPHMLGSLMVASSGLDHEIEALAALSPSPPPRHRIDRVAEATLAARTAVSRASSPDELEEAFESLRAALTGLHMAGPVAGRTRAGARAHTG